MKILLLNNLYQPYNRGGAERILEILNNDLSLLGHQVSIISTRPGRERKKNQEQANVYYLKSSYYHLARHSFFFRLLWQINNIFNVGKYWSIKKIIKAQNPDLIISNNLMGLGLLSLLAIKKSPAKHIHIIHDIQLLHPAGLMYYQHEDIINSLAAQLYQAVIKLFFSKQTTIISPSNWLMDLHVEKKYFLKNKKVILPNPFKLEEKIISNKDAKSFVFIGQLEKHKGVDLFISAATRFPQHQWIVVGDGSLLTEAKLAADKTNNLKILGRLNTEETKKIIASALAVIVPSRCYENSPTVIYEAAAFNVPCLAANLGGIPELINRFGGLLFIPDNLDSLVATIDAFLNKQPLIIKQGPEKNYASEIISI